jgi:hypothetical protein
MKHSDFNYLKIAQRNLKHLGNVTINGERYYLLSVKI